MAEKSTPSSAAGLVSTTIASADDKISHLTRLIASSANADTTLLTIGYTAALLTSALGAVERAQLSAATFALARKLAADAPSALLPGETLVATLQASPNSRVARGQSAARALAAMISEHRMFMRLWGLPKIWVGAARVLRNPPPDNLTRVIAALQLSAGATFQYLENTAFLAMKGVIAMEPRSIGMRLKWSARFWCSYVMLEFIRLLRSRTLARRARQRAIAAGGATEKDVKTEEERVKTEAKWWRDFYINAAWAPVTVHYSLMQSPLPDELIAALSLLAGYMGLKQAWIATA